MWCRTVRGVITVVRTTRRRRPKAGAEASRRASWSRGQPASKRDRPCHRRNNNLGLLNAIGFIPAVGRYPHGGDKPNGVKLVVKGGSPTLTEVIMPEGNPPEGLPCTPILHAPASGD